MRICGARGRGGARRGKEFAVVGFGAVAFGNLAADGGAVEEGAGSDAAWRR
jgi:hypothetical protein